MAKKLSKKQYDKKKMAELHEAIDLLVAIRHLCDRYGESFTALDELAESQYRDELEMERGRQHD